ncbi:FkbM family methyltransferase [Bradyrhizobium prioriisuperbiae]|uniref:FkbM family methyltransferase n=1 Tax=Bradyrhizobium prioriisuperbiae TaxID=2854389 RepID=UPI0028E879FC|nr:FkbM family methyltransferase [Bradyrhizobium prioritasuperba]
MRNITRKLAFVLAASNHGTMIVNRLDHRMLAPGQGYGVGFQILENASFDPSEVGMMVELLAVRRSHYGDGVVAIDCGANIGVHTIEWAQAMTGWGSVVAVEAQERIYYALAGNIAINNCFNARALHAAVSNESGTMNIPNPNYLMASSFGSLELRQRPQTEFIGQAIDYSPEKTVEVRMMKLDELGLARCDLIKIDVEGMEMEALEGGQQTIERAHPIMLIESIKADKAQLRNWLAERGYNVMDAGINLLAIHSSDKTLKDVQAASTSQAAE